MKTMSSRERKLVAGGLLVGLVLLVWLLIVAPVLNGFSERAQEREALRFAYERNARLINAVPALRRVLEKQKPLTAQFALPAATAGQARGMLREKLRREIEATGGSVSTMQDVPTSAGRVRAWAEVTLTLAQLQDVLTRINAAQPYLIVESLRIAADEAMQTGRLEPLEVRIEVSVPHSPSAA